MIRRSLLLLASVLFLLTPRLAQATVMVAPSEDELVSGAQVIGMAVVQRLEVVIAPSGQVMTHAELKIERGVRGADDGDFVSMDYPGGTLPNGLVSSVPGSPNLEVGDRIFAYLRPGRTGALLPIGLRFGVLDVHRGKDGRFRANRRLDGLTLVDKTGAATPTTRYILHDVVVDRLVEDTQARMRKLRIDAGSSSRNTSRGLSIPKVTR
jgi:hypothetical protein